MNPPDLTKILPRPAANRGNNERQSASGAPAPGTFLESGPIGLQAPARVPAGVLTVDEGDADALLGAQLTEQWERAIGGTREQIVFGAMMLKLRDRISSARGRVHPGGAHSKDTGVEGWLKKHAPKISKGTAYRLMEIAEGVQDLCKLGKKVDLEELLAGSVDDLPERLAKKREEIEKLIEGKSQRQLLLAFGGGSGKARGGDTSHAPKLTPEEEQARMEAALREDASVPFAALESMGDAWRILDDAEIEARIEIAEAWTQKARAWLKTPKGKRPVLDRVKAVFKEAH